MSKEKHTTYNNSWLDDAMHVVYARHCPTTGKTYYGSTSDLDHRQRAHHHRANHAATTSNPQYYEDLSRYDFDTTILATVKGKEAALELERHYTSNHPQDTCYNILNNKPRKTPAPYTISESHRANWTAEGKDRLSTLRHKVVDLYRSGVPVKAISQEMTVSKGWIYGVVRDARRAEAGR